jgi:hypothetical protein
MREIGLPVEGYEEQGIEPSGADAARLASFFNQIVSELVQFGGITPVRHLALAMTNLGDK